MDQFSLKLIKSSFFGTALIFGVLILAGSIRNGIPLTLGSGIWGATFLAIAVGAFGSLIGILLVLWAIRQLKTLWN